MILFTDVIRGHRRTQRMSRSQNQAQIKVLLPSVVHVVSGLEQFGPANHLVNRTNPQPRHNSTHLIGNVVKEVDHVLRLALEFLSKLRVLRSDTDWTYILLAYGIQP